MQRAQDGSEIWVCLDGHSLPGGDFAHASPSMGSKYTQDIFLGTWENALHCSKAVDWVGVHRCTAILYQREAEHPRV